GSVKIAGLTVTDGLANGDTSIQPSVGGGVLNSGNGKLELINDVLSNNQAVGDASGSAGGFNGGALGGAIETDGQLTVTDCQFINNQALGADGSSGVNIAGIGTGGAIDSGGDVSITDSLFAGNVARGGNNCNGDRQFWHAWYWLWRRYPEHWPPHRHRFHVPPQPGHRRQQQCERQV